MCKIESLLELAAHVFLMVSPQTFLERHWLK
jgi:hypothetical protein